MGARNHSGLLVLTAASLVSAALGSIHAFSVFLQPLETAFGASRALASLTYSFALVFLTAAVLFGPLIYGRLKPTAIFLLVTIGGVAGAFIAASATTLLVIWIGYSLVFGAANGLGYGFGLQFAARANPEKAGFSMGIVTAAYAFGATIAPYGFEVALSVGGFRMAMLALAGVLCAVGILAIFLVKRSRAEYGTERAATPSTRTAFVPVVKLWLAYGCAVAAGLMAIGHAAGIAASAGFGGWIAPAVLAFCGFVGSLLFGWLIDRVRWRVVLSFLPMMSAAALVAGHYEAALWTAAVLAFVSLLAVQTLQSPHSEKAASNQKSS